MSAGAGGGRRGASVRAAVLTAPGRIELRELPRPAVTAETGLLAVEICGICGTDLKYASGSLAAPLPMILGHEVVGRVAEIGDAAAARWELAPGDRVLIESSLPCGRCEPCRTGAYRLCPTKGGYGTRRGLATPPGLWGGLAELMWLDPATILHRLPDSLEGAAALAIPLIGNAIMWLQRAGGLLPGQRLLIQGPGPQGLAAALVARHAAAGEVVVTGLARDEARLAFAAGLGARTVVTDPGWSRDDALAAIGRDFDLVLDVTGSPGAIAAAPGFLRPAGTFVLAGLVGRGTTVALATDELVWREIRIVPVLAKDEAATRAARALVVGDPALAAAGAAITSHRFPLARAAEALEAVSAGLPGFVKAAVEP